MEHREAQPEMSEAHTNAQQPSSTAPMSTEAKPSLMSEGSRKYFDGAMHEAGEQTVNYEAANGQQQLDDAKAQAQGLWAKYCGCFSSVV